MNKSNRFSDYGMHDEWRLGQEATNLKRVSDLDTQCWFDITIMKFNVHIYERGGKLLVTKQFLTADSTTICIWMRKVLNDYQSWK